MKKNERDWFAIFAGKKVPGMNPQMKLQARLVRAVFQKKSSEIDREIGQGGSGALGSNFLIVFNKELQGKWTWRILSSPGQFPYCFE